MIGKIFGRLTVVSSAPGRGKGAVFRCLCLCGSTVDVRGSALNTGHSTSCGCRRNLGPRTRLAGMVFGELTVEKWVSSHPIRWKCHCSCGGTVVASTADLRKGSVRHCGCLTPASHGLSRHPLYGTHANIMDRCYNPKATHFASYGGRGITVDPRWHAVATFLAECPPKPQSSIRMSLGRIDNDGGYTPQNVRWETPTQQNRNKRNNIFIDTEWGRITVAEASERSGVPARAIRYRLKCGLSESQALAPMRDFSVVLGGMSVKEFAQSRGVLKSTVYERLRRGITNLDELGKTRPSEPVFTEADLALLRSYL
jgi:hypothetical protein